jgi:hypothetical protein
MRCEGYSSQEAKYGWERIPDFRAPLEKRICCGHALKTTGTPVLSLKAFQL